MGRAETETEMIRIARQHNGRYLISLSSWLNHDDEWAICNRLVEGGRARWLTPKSPHNEPSEPGPGIQLLGR